jgi:hypothetical protein
MAHVSSQAIGYILDNYADVIEGGTTWRGSGTSYAGIPGTQSNDSFLRDYTTITATAAGSTTAIVASAVDAASERWERGNTAGFFLRCDTGADGSTDYARRITAWNNTTKTFTVDAFPVAPGDAATFTPLQGFKRLPNGIDIEASGTAMQSGFDRYFDLSLISTAQRDMNGGGYETHDGELVVRVRFLKYSQLHKIRESAAENMAILRSVIQRGDHRDGTYVRAIRPPESAPEVVTDDAEKLVLAQRFPITYRIVRTFG